jgi:hypothetical protein
MHEKNMKKFHKTLLVFLLLLINYPATEAVEGTAPPEKTKKYQLSICSLFKNEAKYLKEWIEYHLLAGVEHFYLYNNNSTDRYYNVLRPYIRKGIVTLINWPDYLGDYDEKNTFIWALSTQVTAYENALKWRALHETEWLALLDVNEYITPIKDNKITDIIKKHKNFPGIAIQTEYYDASQNLDAYPKRHLLIETVELSAPPVQKPHKSIVKMIVQPEQCTSFNWPPYRCNFQNDRSPAYLTRHELRINQYVNRYSGFLYFGKSREKLNVDNRTVSASEITELLQNGYSVDDQEKSIFRFIPQMLKTMGYDFGWEAVR